MCSPVFESFVPASAFLFPFRVKYQLENIYDAMNRHDRQVELGSIPSVDIRSVVKKILAPSANGGPSFQFQDMFVNGDTVKHTANGKLPWEYGRNFKEQKLMETGYEYKLPSGPVGTVIDLYAPSRHKLLVKYCPHCIGVIAMVHDWNEAVEKGLGKNVDELKSEVREGWRGKTKRMNVML
jgi:hypothetical protein